MQAGSIDRKVVLSDFVKTISAIPGTVVEISKAAPGGSSFNRAFYYDNITVEIIEELLTSNTNLGFLPGVDQDKLQEGIKEARESGANVEELTFGVERNRSTKNEMIHYRNIISIEIDFKDFVPGFLTLFPGEKLSIIKTRFNEIKPKLEARFARIWIACFSGNGLHLHFKLSKPIDCTDSKKYSEHYDHLINFIEQNVFEEQYKFDRNCKNAARLIRLIYSKNLKIKNRPIQTEVLCFNQQADASLAIHEIWQAAEAYFESLEMSSKAYSQSSESVGHKEALRKALTFKSTLKHFGYLKTHTLRELKNGEVLCSSPWREDRNPSCSLNEIKKQFIDHSSGKGGDIFTFIAELASLNIKTDFLRIIEVAEKITGIKKVIPMKNQFTESRANQEGNTESRGPKRKKATSNDYFKFFDEHLPGAKRDVLSNELMFLHEGILKKAISRLSVLGSFALDSENLKKTDLQEHLARYAETKPLELLIDLPEWDQVDRLQRIAKCVEVKNCKKEHFEQLLKEWGATVFKRLYNSKTQNKIFILKGGQGVGKDTLVDNLLGGFGKYFSNLTISRNEENNLAMLADHLVLNISEFDRTSKTDAATLKDWTTRSQAEFRRPYARGTETYQLKHSFIATVNVDDILRDPTGNRRFMIFEIERIDWSYPQGESLQILSQFKQLAKEDFKASSEAQDVMKKYIEDHTPDNPEEIMLEIWDDRVTELLKGNPSLDEELTGSKVQHILFDVSRMFNTHMKNFQSILKRNGRSRRKTTGIVYFRKQSES